MAGGERSRFAYMSRCFKFVYVMAMLILPPHVPPRNSGTRRNPRSEALLHSAGGSQARLVVRGPVPLSERRHPVRDASAGSSIETCDQDGHRQVDSGFYQPIDRPRLAGQALDMSGAKSRRGPLAGPVDGATRRPAAPVLDILEHDCQEMYVAQMSITAYSILLIHESPLTDALFLLVSKSDEVTTT